MLTPKDVQEKTFPKAMLGGYDMSSVDVFLDELTKDYETLYQENDVLKEKLRVLVKKLEEYHNSEIAQNKRTDTVTADEATEQEAARVARAREAALSFIEAIEKDVRAHLTLLDDLKSRDLGTAAKSEEAPAEPQTAENEAYPMNNRPTMRFDDLKFGRNYQPEGK